MKDKILITLGDTVLANSVQSELGKLNYETLIVQDGNKVLESLKTFNPSLLVIDLNISGKNGYEVLSEKSYDKLVTKIPVIIVSNTSSAIEMKRIPSTPTIKDFVIRAHVEPNEVIEKVQKFFGKEMKTATHDVAPVSLSKKILWVEDDKLLSAILSKKLIKAGFTLTKTSNSDETFAYLDKESPDLIILDILLPGANGMDILQRIRGMEKFRKLPAIILSNMNTQDYIDKAKFLGVKKFIVKAAMSLEEILREIKEVLNIK